MFPRPPEYQRSLAAQYPNNRFLPRVWCQVNMPGTAAAAGSAKGCCPLSLQSLGNNIQAVLSQRNWCCVIKQRQAVSAFPLLPKWLFTGPSTRQGSVKNKHASDPTRQRSKTPAIKHASDPHSPELEAEGFSQVLWKPE